MLAVSALFIANDAAAALTEAKACDTCDYREALRIAKLYYERPNCEVRNLNDGKPEFGVTLINFAYFILFKSHDKSCVGE